MNLFCELGVIWATMYPCMFFHELGHYLELRKLGAKFRMFQVGFPVVFKKGIFHLGLLPFTGSVESSINPHEMKSSDRIRVASAGPLCESWFSMAAMVFFTYRNLSLSAIFYEHWALGCVLDLLPQETGDGYLVWLNSSGKWRTVGVRLWYVMKVANFSFGLLRFVSWMCSGKELIKDIVDTYQHI